METPDLVTHADIAGTRAHWLIGSLSPDEVTAARSTADRMVAFRALPGRFVGSVSADDITQVRGVALAYEMAAAPYAPVFDSDAVGASDRDDAELKLARASATFAYDLLRAVPSDAEGDGRLLDVLSLCAMAYVGDRGTDLGLVLGNAPPAPRETSWDRQLLSRLYECWLRLFDKRRYPDLGWVASTIQVLRDEQGRLEAAFLHGVDDPGIQRVRGFQLLALYNWARATEILAAYLRSGALSDENVDTRIDQFFSAAERAATSAEEHVLVGLFSWLRAAAHRMALLSLWRAARDDEATRLVKRLATEAVPTLEFLPPQRAALLDLGVLDRARTAVVVDMPTSSGKTLLAEFRIVQTLYANRASRAWVAYVVPTRALGAQIVRRLRREIGPDYKVESLSAAVEVDSLEADLLADESPFDVLVCTPEKLGSILRGGTIARPLRLVVIDEAHGLEGKSRGLRLELLLATLRAETQTDFMLLMPYVPNGKQLAGWLSRNGEVGASSASFSTTAWKPNDVLVGTFAVERSEQAGAGAARQWSLRFDPIAARRALHLGGSLRVSGDTPLNVAMSAIAGNATMASAAMAVAFDDPERGVNLVMCTQIRATWSAAETLLKAWPDAAVPDDDIELVRRFVRTELGSEFLLDQLLARRIGVHHAGLPDDVRILMEWLIERGKLRAVCATSTIAQGINFPVGSVFLNSLSVRDGKRARDMTSREFWNLAGRAGRIGQAAVGLVGIFERDREKAVDIVVNDGLALVSQLETMALALDATDFGRALSTIRYGDDWAEFRSYVAHVCANRARPHRSDADQLLRNTFGFGRLTSSEDPALRQKAEIVRDATRIYVETLANERGTTSLSDSTGFPPEAVNKARNDLRAGRLTARDWDKERLFSGSPQSALPRLIGALLEVPQIKVALAEIGGSGHAGERIAAIASDWVNGLSIEDIAKRHFSARGGKAVRPVDAVSSACRAIYKSLTFAAPWGLSALMQLPTSGLDLKSRSPEELRELNLLPAYLYHGVKTEAGVAMRINGVPRTVAEPLGAAFEEVHVGEVPKSRVARAREWLESLGDADWDVVRPAGSALTGGDYRRVWVELSS